MSSFIGGAVLCERFFHEAAKPILDRAFPELRYTAGLLGYGSDVLGYDDAVSTDHMWGPRFYLFLEEKELHRKDDVMEVFSRALPHSFLGYSVNFSEPDPDDGGVQHAAAVDEGPVSPLIFIDTVDGFIRGYLGTADLDSLTEVDWLSFSEHKLLALRLGRFYVDDLSMVAKLKKLDYYPNGVWRYLIASQWALISEEQAFVKRCGGSAGDELGSRLCCARIADRVMRLCFLYARTYAPYSKWYGTAFARLDTDPGIKDALAEALSANDLLQREEAIAQAQALTAALHNAYRITEPVEYRVESYFDRDIKVIFADKFASATAAALKGTALEGLPLIGKLDQVGNMVELTDDTTYRERIRRFYRT